MSHLDDAIGDAHDDECGYPNGWPTCSCGRLEIHEAARAELASLRERVEDLERCVRASLGAYGALRTLGAEHLLPGLTLCEKEARKALRGTMDDNTPTRPQ